MIRKNCSIRKRSLALAAAFCIAFTGTAYGAGAPEEGWYQETYHSDKDYSEMKYEGFDRSKLDGLLDELERILDSGEAGRETTIVNLYWEISSQIDWLLTQKQLNSLIYYKDATNEEAQIREQELNQIVNEAGDRTYTVLKRVLDSPYHDVLAAEIGESGLEQLEAYEPMTEREFELQEQETKLVQEYNEAVLASYTAVVDGEEWTTERYNEEPPEDYGKDLAVYKALMVEKNQAAGEIYQEMVQVRNEIAREQGYDNFAEYAYEEIYQRDFSTEDIQSVYKEVKEYIVPLLNDLTIASSMTDLEALVEATADKTGEEILDEIEPFIGQVHPALTEAFAFMREHHLYDIEADEKKLNVGFTTSLPSYGVPFIFNKPYGYYADYKTMIHEFGHYNQQFHSTEQSLWETSRMDVYEIHSQGLEVLFYPYAEELFGDGGETFQYETIGGMLYSIREGCLYDEFQNQVYSSPDMTLEEINQTFLRLSSEYGYQYEEGEDQAYSWVEVPHTFESPMYYIGYATSALAALDIWTESLEDREAAVDKYMRLTQIGGSEPFCKVMEDSGFDDIFQEGVIGEMAVSIRDIMDIEEKVAEYTQQAEQGTEGSGIPAAAGTAIMAAAAILLVAAAVLTKKRRSRQEQEERTEDDGQE